MWLRVINLRMHQTYKSSKMSTRLTVCVHHWLVYACASCGYRTAHWSWWDRQYVSWACGHFRRMVAVLGAFVLLVSNRPTTHILYCSMFVFVCVCDACTTAYSEHGRHSHTHIEFFHRSSTPPHATRTNTPQGKPHRILNSRSRANVTFNIYKCTCAFDVNYELEQGQRRRFRRS